MLLSDLGAPAWQVAAALNEAPRKGLIEAYASYSSVGLDIDPDLFDPQELQSVESTRPNSEPKVHRIPVCYELGQDLQTISAAVGLSPDAVINLHTSVEYTCQAVGFCPGFPYLSGLPQQLCGLPRLPAPRVRIEPGTVAITGKQCGIYPIVRPGGWNLIGRTPLTLVDVQSNYFPIEAGDTICFSPIKLKEFEERLGERL